MEKVVEYVYHRILRTKKHEFAKVEDIKNFRPKNTADFHKTKLYMIKCSDGEFHRSQILQLGISLSDLQSQLEIQNSRWRYVKGNDGSFTEDEDFGEPSSVKAVQTQAKKDELVKKSKKSADKRNLMTKVKSIAQKFTLDPELTGELSSDLEDTSDREGVTSNDETFDRDDRPSKYKAVGIGKKGEINEAAQKNNIDEYADEEDSEYYNETPEKENPRPKQTASNVDEKKSNEKDLNKEVLDLKKKIEILEKQKSSLKRKLDFNHDGCENEKRENNSGSQRKNIRDIEDLSEDDSDDEFDENTENVSEKKKYAIFERRTKSGKRVKLIHLGSGFSMKLESWENLMNKKPSEFVRQLAIVLWPETVLVNRFIHNNNPGMIQLPDRSPRKQLTPIKKKTLEKCFRDYIHSKYTDEEKRKAEIKKCGSHLSQKIKSLRKQLYPDLKKTVGNVNED